MTGDYNRRSRKIIRFSLEGNLEMFWERKNEGLVLPRSREFFGMTILEWDSKMNKKSMLRKGFLSEEFSFESKFLKRARSP